MSRAYCITISVRAAFTLSPFFFDVSEYFAMNEAHLEFHCPLLLERKLGKKKKKISYVKNIV